MALTAAGKRLSSFSTWPRALTQRPKELADAGLSYSGEGDWCKCDFCKIDLKDWLPSEEPLQKHLKESPHCPFIAEINMVFFTSPGSFKTTVNSIEAQTGIIGPTHNLGRLQSPLAESSTSLMEKGKLAGEAYKEVPFEFACKVCYTKEIEIAFLPCSHAAVCTECALQLHQCAICNGKIQSLLRIKLPR